MDTKNAARYFLGANSKDGFISLYDSFVDLAAGDFLWVIKGGPGCGKSSFMKRIGRTAEEKGLPVEYIHCSGDPDSLDGVWLPSLRTGYVDGTAPHVMEAVYPGAASLYLDLGTFYDAGALEQELDQVVDLNRRYKALYNAAYAQLAAAGALDVRACPGLWGEAEKEKLLRKAAGFAAREFRGGRDGGTVRQRFLSAISCRGRVFFRETLESQCDRLCWLDNGLGMGWFFLDALAGLALEKGLSVTLCRDPLFPEKTEALLLPELSLGLVAGEAPAGSPVYRHMRLDALAGKSRLAEERPRLRALRKEQAALLSAAMGTLAQAKELHDRLEQVYNPHVDFDGLYAAADDHIAWLLGKQG
ncbi:MAG: hypothetical protein ACI4PC_04810 [Oscillospiraceae bacterium]